MRKLQSVFTVGRRTSSVDFENEKEVKFFYKTGRKGSREIRKMEIVGKVKKAHLQKIIRSFDLRKQNLLLFINHAEQR